MVGRKFLLAATGLVASLFVAVTAFGGSQVTGDQHPSRYQPHPRGNFALAEARAFGSFPLYYAGQSTESLPLVAIHRVEADARQGGRVSPDYVSFLYGSCNARIGEGCIPPLQIQVWNACERYQALYPFAPDESLTVRGVPAAMYEGKTRLELSTETATIVIFGEARDQLLEVARTLRGLNRALLADKDLPAPTPGVREGNLACQQM